MHVLPPVISTPSTTNISSPPRIPVAAIPKLVRAYDEPFGNASAIASYYCADLARQNGVEVLLAGDGGDELFGGNSRYAADKVFDLYRSPSTMASTRMPRTITVQLAAPQCQPRTESQELHSSLEAFLSPNGFFLIIFFTRSIYERYSLTIFLVLYRADPGLAIATDHYCSASAASTLNRLLYVDLRIAIADNDLRKVSRTAELAKVQVRYPMLDLTLVNLSGRIPASMKLKGFS